MLRVRLRLRRSSMLSFLKLPYFPALRSPQFEDFSLRLLNGFASSACIYLWVVR